jgi:hypothetical protein
VGATLRPSGDVWIGNDDLCDHEIFVKVEANGNVRIGSPDPVDQRIGPGFAAGLAPSAEYIVQATPPQQTTEQEQRREQRRRQYRGDFTFASAQLSAESERGVAGIGWPGVPDWTGTECVDDTACEILQPSWTRVRPARNTPGRFTVFVR